ncbi:hypothetical protein [Agromyces sp. Leaf222]|uniref:hypothetical protein n=1 Tax=Agromyces sp. Leaf222 TaxID=1735688 RepID=UPI0006FD5C07|nr:hypothetical protein [Agromyces sp. Leaf222]KQM80721.1 hypothetical protein ASE68_19555 [Agromyces sp. Leaf222]
MSTRTPEQARKRRLITGISLAAVAVLGVGAAITTAAWTDNVWFSATANTSSIELLGAVGETEPAPGDAAWEEADEESTAVVIPAASFADLVPEETRAVQIWLWNDSTVDLSVELATLDLTGNPLFDPSLTTPSSPAAIGVFTDEAGTTAYTTTVIPAGDTLGLWVVVQTPDWVSPADDAMQDVTSPAVPLQFIGSTVPTP